MKFKKHIIVLSVALLAVFIASKAYANPFSLTVTTQTATATSTVSQVVAGVATTTLAYDAYATYGQYTAAEGATLLIQTQASSTASVVNLTFEYSQDGIDWYSDNLNYRNGSTTIPYSINTPNSFTFGASSTSRALRAVFFATPVRYTRAVISATASSSFVWAQIVPLKQVKE